MADEVNGKNVTEIIRLLRQIKGSENKGKEVANKPCNINRQFPWIADFTVQCLEVAQEPSVKKINILISDLLKNLDKDIKQCYTRPVRANNLREDVALFLKFFHWLYLDMKTPLDHTMYLDKMSDTLAHYIDLEIKSSKTCKEFDKNVSQRIMTHLFLLLDGSKEHMLDAVLKAKLFTRKNRQICAPVMERLLQETPAQIYDGTYVRYILAFKLWKRLASNKAQSAKIRKRAVEEVVPPPDFLDKLKAGQYANIFPHVPKSDRERMTTIFMQAKFSEKKKAMIFLKECRKIQTNSVIDQPIFDEDYTVISFFDGDSEETDILESIWKRLNKDLVTTDDLDDETEDLSEDWLSEMKSPEEEVARPVHRPVEETRTVEDSPVQKRRKTANVGSCVGIKKSIKSKTNGLVSKNLTKRSLNMDDGPTFEGKPLKPCATVEPAQASEIAPDSSRMTELFSTVSLNPSRVEAVTNVNEMDIERETTAQAPTESVGSSTVIVIEDEGKSNDSKLEDKLVEEQPVAQEVVIDTSSGTHPSTIFVIEDSSNETIQDIGVPNNEQLFLETAIANPAVVKTTPLTSPTTIREVNDGYVSLDRRQDSYACNDSMLSRLLYDVNTSDNSDDEQRPRPFVGSGKVAAFRAQMEESKSDDGEETNSLTSSQSMSVDSPMGSQHSLIESPTQTLKNQQHQGLQPIVVIDRKLELDETSKNMSAQHLGVDVNDASGMLDSSLHLLTADRDFKYSRLLDRHSCLYRITTDIMKTAPPPPLSLDLPNKGVQRCQCELCYMTFCRLQQLYQAVSNERSIKLCAHFDKMKTYENNEFLIENKIEKELHNLKSEGVATLETKDNKELMKTLVEKNKAKVKTELNFLHCNKKTKDFDVHVHFIETNKGRTLINESETIDLTACDSKEILSVTNDLVLENNVEITPDDPVNNNAQVNDASDSSKLLESQLPPKKRRAFSFADDKISTKILKASNEVSPDLYNNEESSLKEDQEKSKDKSQEIDVSSPERNDKCTVLKIKTVDGQYCLMSNESNISDENSSDNANYTKQKKKSKDRKTKEEKRRMRREMRRQIKLEKLKKKDDEN